LSAYSVLAEAALYVTGPCGRSISGWWRWWAGVAEKCQRSHRSPPWTPQLWRGRPQVSWAPCLSREPWCRRRQPTGYLASRVFGDAHPVQTGRVL